jgi:hypothetical protein
MIDFWRSQIKQSISITIEGDDIEKFKELVQRGSNLWPDAPASIKEFADQVTTGTVLQDYKSQEKKATK